MLAAGIGYAEWKDLDDNLLGFFLCMGLGFAFHAYSLSFRLSGRADFSNRLTGGNDAVTRDKSPAEFRRRSRFSLLLALQMIVLAILALLGKL